MEDIGSISVVTHGMIHAIRSALRSGTSLYPMWHSLFECSNDETVLLALRLLLADQPPTHHRAGSVVHRAPSFATTVDALGLQPNLTLLYPPSCDDTNAALATFLQHSSYRPCLNNPTFRRLGLTYLASYLLSFSPSPSALPNAFASVGNPAVRYGSS